MKNHMGIDQHGIYYHNLGPHPRKELMERIGSKHVSKMYVDDSSRKGGALHVGYVVGRHWVRLYKVEHFSQPA